MVMEYTYDSKAQKNFRDSNHGSSIYKGILYSFKEKTDYLHDTDTLKLDNNC